MPVSCSMRRNVQPSRPNARTCCRFSSLKTLLMPTKATAPYVGINVPDSFPLAGFEVTLFGRFWMTPEVPGEMLGPSAFYNQVVAVCRNGKRYTVVISGTFVHEEQSLAAGSVRLV